MSTATDLLVRIRRRDHESAPYPVEAELGDGSRFSGGTLTLDQKKLLAAFDDGRAYGELLFGALFQGEIRTAFDRAMGVSREAPGDVGIRLLLDPDAPELEAVRWERIYLERGGTWVPLSAAGVTGFSRYVSLTTPEPRPVATRPIRILLAVSNPSNLATIELQPVQVAQEVQAFYEALKDARSTDEVEVTVLARREDLGASLCSSLESDGFEIVDGRTTLSEIVRRLSGSHVVHFVGHGAFDRDPGPDGHRESALFLEGDDGTFRAVTADELMQRFVSAEAVPSLVYLSACESGRRETGTPHPFVGLGQTLVDAGVAAVVAMQDVIPVATARSLTRDFYTALLTHGLVDRALNKARSVVFDDATLAWSVPVLFTSLRHGRLLVEHDLANRVIADDILLTPGAEHGAAADRVASVPAPRLRPTPVLRLPRDFPDLLGRAVEVEGALAELAKPSLVEFAGTPGSGKTVLLRHVANRAQQISADGVIHLANGGEPVRDVLVFLFDALYEADASLRPTDADVLRLLSGCGPVIVVDDADVPRDALGKLIEQVPNGRFLFAAAAQNLWGEGHALPLGGLPADAALELFTGQLGRALTAEEQSRAAALCTALGGHPLHILQAAQLAAGGSWPEVPQAPSAPDGAPAAPVASKILDALAAPKRDVLAVIAAAGAPIRVEHIEAVTGQPDTESICEELRQLALVKTASPRYALAEPLPAEYMESLGVAAWRARLLSYLAKWVEQNSQSPGTVTRDLDVVIAVLGAADDKTDPALVLRLARGAEGPLILAKRWERWSALIGREQALATATNDRAALGWALHQAGTRALALADEKVARERLTQALAIRRELGDDAGAALTHHNLELLGPVPPPSNPGSQEGRPKPDWRNGWLGPPSSWIVIGALAIATVAAVAAAAVALARPSTSTPTPAPSPPSAELDPRSVDFGRLELGSSSSATITLHNGGEGPLAVSSVTLDPPGADLVLTNGCSRSLSFKDACVITVTFTPASAGSRVTNLVIQDNTPQATHIIPVSAEGLVPPATAAPTPVLTAAPTPILTSAVVTTPSSLDFGTVAPGTAVQQKVTLTGSGSGSGDLVISEVRPPDGADFAIAGEDCTNRIFGPGQGCTILVTFRPTTQGPLGSTLTIIDNTSDASHSVTLAGAGNRDLPDLLSNLDTTGRAAIVSGGSVIQPIVIHIMNVGTADAGSFAVGASAQRPTDASVVAVGLVLYPTPGVVVGSSGKPEISGLAANGPPIELNGLLVFPPGSQGGVIVRILPDSCAGEDQGDPILVEHCHVWESDEGNNASNQLPVALPSFVILGPGQVIALPPRASAVP
jgi:hypothetical protein